MSSEQAERCPSLRKANIDRLLFRTDRSWWTYHVWWYHISNNKTTRKKQIMTEKNNYSRSRAWLWELLRTLMMLIYEGVRLDEKEICALRSEYRLLLETDRTPLYLYLFVKDSIFDRCGYPTRGVNSATKLFNKSCDSFFPHFCVLLWTKITWPSLGCKRTDAIAMAVSKTSVWARWTPDSKAHGFFFAEQFRLIINCIIAIFVVVCVVVMLWRSLSASSVVVAWVATLY